jgi:hypothetical protein
MKILNIFHLQFKISAFIIELQKMAHYIQRLFNVKEYIINASNVLE